MAQAMFGVETEFAISGVTRSKPIPREELVGRFINLARQRLAHLPDACSSSGIFSESGARLYIDCGLHPEWATPECTTPWELARYIKAGELILEGLIREMQSEAGADAEIMLFRVNVDYSGSGNTWGCHESYLHSGNPASLPALLIPHLVTRLIYTGAGGFNPLANGLEFLVAPRMMHIEQPISGDSTGNRGIFHTRMESLARDGYHRLHILAGESLCSETAIVLKIGTTALVTAMAEQGLKPGVDMKLASPVSALHAVASDVTCSQKLYLTNDRETTALEMQRKFLQMAERNLEVLPPWSSQICSLWRLALDQLESGAPDSTDAVLDWAIKRRLFRDRAGRAGVAWARFPFLNSIITELRAAISGAGLTGGRIPFGLILGPDTPIPAAAASMGDKLAKEGLGWSDVECFLNLRDEFFQIDTRFGQLGPRSIFGELDRHGVLNHKSAGVKDIESAMSQPPSVGRARIRGEAIRRLSGAGTAVCTWAGIVGHDGKTLDLSDPFRNEEVWTDEPGPQDLEDLLGLGDRFGDPGRVHQMIDSMRRRYGRSRSGSQGSPETTESPF